MTARLKRRPLAAASLGLALASAISGAAPAAADWLVLTDGTRIETRGAWEQRGRRLVFTAAGGTLSSLKTDQVDLAASRAATEAAADATARARAGTEGPAPAPRRAARRFTNADIPRGVPREPSATAGAGAAGEAGAGTEPGAEADESSSADEPPASPVVVDGWEQGEDVDGSVVVVGRARNTSDRVIAAAVRLEVVLFDREGLRLAETPATVVPSALPPGATGEFRAEFPGIYDFSLVRFEIASSGIETGEGAPPRALGDAAAGAAAGEEDGPGP